MSSPSSTVRSRGDAFTPTLSTKITQEVACEHNPYLSQEVRIHGYDHLELMQKCQASDVIYLLLRGELPQPEEANLFRELFIALINPGPRHPATQASITAGVGKTLSTNILPIALSLYGGKFDGTEDAEEAMRFYRRYSRKSVSNSAAELETMALTNHLPGFGNLYGDVDCYAEKLLQTLSDRHQTPVLQWVYELHQQLVSRGIGIMRSGVFAAAAADLGFQPRQGSALMQLIAAPGLLAHGLEYSNKPLTSMLFEPDDHYFIEDDPATSAPLTSAASRSNQETNA